MNFQYVKPPCTNVKPPYWRLSGDGSGGASDTLRVLRCRKCKHFSVDSHRRSSTESNFSLQRCLLLRTSTGKLLLNCGLFMLCESAVQASFFRPMLTLYLWGRSTDRCVKIIEKEHVNFHCLTIFWLVSIFYNTAFNTMLLWHIFLKKRQLRGIFNWSVAVWCNNCSLYHSPFLK